MEDPFVLIYASTRENVSFLNTSKLTPPLNSPRITLFSENNGSVNECHIYFLLFKYG